MSTSTFESRKVALHELRERELSLDTQIQKAEGTEFVSLADQLRDVVREAKALRAQQGGSSNGSVN